MKTLGANVICVGMLVLLLSGCVSTQHAPKMRDIQQTRGNFSHSLWYLGSTAEHHYFEQNRCRLIPFKEYTKRFRVPFSELMMFEELVFPFEASHYGTEGNWSSNVRDVAIKVRISKDLPYAVVPRELRSTVFARKLDAKHEKLKASARRVNATLISLYELQLPLSKLSSSCREERKRWPISIEEFKAFATASTNQNESINWPSYEPISIAELADGSFEIKCIIAHTPTTILVPKSPAASDDTALKSNE